MKKIRNAVKSICKIRHENNDETGTGFFMRYNSFFFLVTNYHVVSEGLKNIEIEISNKNIINLNLNNKNKKFLPEPIDITAIQIFLNEYIEQTHWR